MLKFLYNFLKSLEQWEKYEPSVFVRASLVKVKNNYFIE